MSRFFCTFRPARKMVQRAPKISPGDHFQCHLVTIFCFKPKNFNVNCQPNCSFETALTSTRLLVPSSYEKNMKSWAELLRASTEGVALKRCSLAGNLNVSLGVEVFLHFPAELGPRTALNGSSSKHGAARTQNQPRGPLLRMFGCHCQV